MKPESMVGLSIVLEGEQSSSNNNTAGFLKQVMVNKASAAAARVVMTSHFSISSYVIPHLSSPRHSVHFPSRPPVFLDVCFLCKNDLLQGKDIYMYKGDKGFCSVECRCRQILLDEHEQAGRSSHHGSPSPRKASRCRKMTKNRDGNGSTAG